MKKYIKNIGVTTFSLLFLTGCSLVDIQVEELQDKIIELENLTQQQSQAIKDLEEKNGGIPTLETKIKELEDIIIIKDEKLKSLEDESDTISYLGDELDKLRNEPKNSASTNETNSVVQSLVFDKCGGTADFQNEGWFAALSQKYKELIIDTRENTGYLTIHQGCLSQDKSTFIFIPGQFRCGKIFKYDIKNNSLPPYITAEHCASSFGNRVGDYIPFEGSKIENNCTTRYNGKYFFIEHVIRDVNITKENC